MDDATSAVISAVFSPEEDTCSYFTLMRGRTDRTLGRPIASTATATARSNFPANPGASNRGASYPFPPMLPVPP